MRFRSTLGALCSDLLELAWPRACLGCEAAGPSTGLLLCSDCRSRLPRWPEDREPATELPPLTGCSSAWRYEGEVEAWIQRFKYPGAGLAGLDPAPSALMRSWARELAERVPGPDPAWVVPIPLHRRRLAERGFNPAALIARELALARNATLAPRALLRIRDTPSQTGLGRRERRRNVAGAFSMRTPRSRPGALDLAPLPEVIWLVDDVVTTGATLCEAARVLRRAGAGQVRGVSLARVP